MWSPNIILVRLMSALIVVVVVVVVIVVVVAAAAVVVAVVVAVAAVVVIVVVVVVVVVVVSLRPGESSPLGDTGVWGKKHSSGEEGRQIGKKVFGAPNQGLDSDYC